MAQRTDGNAFHHITNNARLAARGNGVDTRTASHVSGLQFGTHAASSEAETLSPAIARSASSMPYTSLISSACGLLRGSAVYKPFDRSAATVYRHPPESPPAQKVIVITDLNLCSSDSIVLINYRNDIVIEQRTGYHGRSGSVHDLPYQHGSATSARHECRKLKTAVPTVESVDSALPPPAAVLKR